MSVSLTTLSRKAHAAKEAAIMKKSLISATMVASLAILAVLSGCGGGGSSSDVPPQQMPAVVVVTPAPAASAPTVTIQSVAKVTLTTSVVSTGTDIGSVSDLKASDVADGVVTDKAVWTVSVIGGTPTGALTVSSTGKVLAGGKPLVVPVGSTWTISGTATLGGKTVDFSFIVTGKCTDGLTANGAGCKFVGQTAMSDSLTTALSEFRQVVGGQVVKKFVFDGVTFPVMKACVSSSASYSRVTCLLLDGKSSVTYDLTVDGKIAVVDNVYHAAELDYGKALNKVGTACDSNARTSYLLTSNVCASNSKVDTFAWSLQYPGGVSIYIDHLVSAANFD